MSQPVLTKAAPRYFQLAEYNLSICSIFIFLDILIVGLRVWSRRRQRLSFQLEDWVIFPALILVLGSAATMIYSIKTHAMGYPITPPASQSSADLTALTDQIHETSKAEYAMFLTLIPALTCIKLSFLAFYKRIFCVHKISRIRYFILGLIVFVALWGVVFFFVHLFMCGTNFSAFWSSFESLATRCIHTMQMQYAFSVTDFVSDLIVLILPLPLLWQLRLPPSQKIAVSFVFLLGSGAVVSSGIRLAFVIQAVNKGFSNGEDGDLVITGMMSWLQVEASLGLIAACLPTIRCLFKDLSTESIFNTLRSMFSWRSNSSHSRLSELSDGVTDSHQNLAIVDSFIMDDRSTRKNTNTVVVVC